MKGMMNLVLALLMVLVVVLACGKISTTPTDEELDEVSHLAWCDQIYHQNVGCPKHGQVIVPPEVLAKQLAEHNEWCDSIYHRNASCPGYDAKLAE